VQFGINLSLPPNENETGIRLNLARPGSVQITSQKIEFGAIPPNPSIAAGQANSAGDGSLMPGRIRDSGSGFP
jgi:hypothetical protein